MQPVVATSSTEATLMTAVSGGKSLLCVWSILKELGFSQDMPSPIYEDNAAAIMMTNQNKPTDRTRHINIQFFAIQQWIEQKHMLMRHIPGKITLRMQEPRHFHRPCSSAIPLAPWDSSVVHAPPVSIISRLILTTRRIYLPGPEHVWTCNPDCYSWIRGRCELRYPGLDSRDLYER